MTQIANMAINKIHWFLFNMRLFAAGDASASPSAGKGVRSLPHVGAWERSDVSGSGRETDSGSATITGI
jgi:hypothetical protein